MKIVTNIPLVGNSHCLSADDVTNFDQAIELLTNCSDTVVDIQFMYDEILYTGSMAKSDDDLMLLLVITNGCVALPQGQCIEFECSDEDSTSSDDMTCDLEAVSLSDDTLLVVMGDDGCPSATVSYATLKDSIVSEVRDSLLSDINFCDFFPNGEIPSGSLLAGDQILTSDSQGDTCSFKLVPTTDIVCPE